MKKKMSIVLAITAVLLAVALIMMATIRLEGKLTKGGCAVRVNVGSSYDEDIVKSYVASAGFNRPVVLNSTRTALEIETGSMNATELNAASDKLLASMQVDYPQAQIVYAEPFGAMEGVHHFRHLLQSMIALIVIGYIYGALRFGWLKGITPVLTAVVASCLTGSVCALLSNVFTVGSVLVGTVVGTACLTYVFAVVICLKFKSNTDYAVNKADLAVPILTVVTCVLVTVFSGALGMLCPVVLGSVLSAVGMYCLTPIFWKAFEK